MARAAYAKLCGHNGIEPVDVFITSCEIYMGRNSKNSTVDVVLGQELSISRKHATITWDPATRQWHLRVLGKSPLTCRRGEDVQSAEPDGPAVQLQSGDEIKGQECTLIFLLPRDPPLMHRNGTQQQVPAQAPARELQAAPRLQAPPQLNAAQAPAALAMQEVQAPVQPQTAMLQQLAEQMQPLQQLGVGPAQLAQMTPQQVAALQQVQHAQQVQSAALQRQQSQAQGQAQSQLAPAANLAQLQAGVQVPQAGAAQPLASVLTQQQQQQPAPAQVPTHVGAQPPEQAQQELTRLLNTANPPAGGGATALAPTQDPVALTLARAHAHPPTREACNVAQQQDSQMHGA